MNLISKNTSDSYSVADTWYLLHVDGQVSGRLDYVKSLHLNKTNTFNYIEGQMSLREQEKCGRKGVPTCLWRQHQNKNCASGAS